MSLLKTHRLSTHELRDGDIVLVYGMRVRLDGAGNESKAHPQHEHSPTLYWDGVIENLAEVLADGYVPKSFVRDGGLWTIQGNGLAHWTVERKSAVIETVWCEAHGGLSNPHFERDDCQHPHFTDQATRDRMNAERNAT